MAAPVDIVTTEEGATNLSLGHLRQPPIANLSDNNDRARAAKAFFATARDAALRLRWWNFATAWVTPAASAQVHPSRLKTIYVLPDDCVAVRFIDGCGDDEWQVESCAADPAGGAAKVPVLITNRTAPLICYTARITEVRLWDPDFLVAFSYQHAAFAGPQLGASSTRVESLHALANSWRDEAGSIDAQEKSIELVSKNTSWLAARRRGGSIVQR